ncbi:MAG: phosphatidate cytidylyltransferase [Treponema sp.]|jgi:phosphatidate cytidylyltransferase|nr:phosphatidate cytidylyltransferase [Treponema sp.]
MEKIIKRLLVFFIGVPAVVFLILLLPYFKNLPFNIVVIIFSVMGAIEFSAILEKKQMRVSKIEAAIFGAFAPLAVTLTVCLDLPEWKQWIIPLFMMAGASWVILSLAFTSSVKMDNVIGRLAGCFSVIIYPGLFMSWIIKISTWEIPGAILLFLLIIFANDSAAWLTGSLLGANNKGIFAASPNKSIAGYIGGLAGAVIISVSAALLAPSVFLGSISYVKIIILGIFTAVFGNLGDLAESAIKRSGDVKDSGNLMLGRGGILDSIDSLAAAAPVYFMLFNVFFINS